MGSRFRFFIIATTSILLIAFPESGHAQWWWPFGETQKPAQRLAPARRAPAPAPAQRQCLGTTNEGEQAIERALRAPTRGTFAAHWASPTARQRFTEACRAESGSQPVINRANMNAVRSVGSLRQGHVSRACIRAAIVARANDNIDATRTLCTPNARVVRSTPCLTDNYVNYVHFAVNSAIRCMSSPGNELDPDTIFDKINNESAFMGFAHNSGGVGLMQMTSIAAREVFNPDQAGRQHVEEMMGRPEKRTFCAPFRPMLMTVQGSVNSCQWLGVENGMARNAFAGIALMSYYQKSIKEKLVAAGIPRSNSNFETAVRSLSLVAYNAGMSRANVVLSKIGARNLARSTNAELTIRNAALRYAANSYLSDVIRSRSQIPNAPRTCWEAP